MARVVYHAECLVACNGELRCTDISVTTLRQCPEAEVVDGNCTNHFKKNVLRPLKKAAKQDSAFQEECENAKQKLRNAQAKVRFERVNKRKLEALRLQQELLERRNLFAEDFSYKKRIVPEDFESKPVAMLSARLSKRARAVHDDDGDVIMEEGLAASPAGCVVCIDCDEPVADSAPTMCMGCDGALHSECLDNHHDACNGRE